MEAHFLTSNSFTKTTHFVPSFIPKRIPTQIFSTKVRFPISTTCCQLGSSPSPSGDEERLSVDSDWRSFRAKLVVGEHQKLITADQSQAQYQQIEIGEKWAHKIHEPEKGCLLIASEKLDGVHIFERTVILLLSTGPVGPSGIILNRPSLMSIKEMRSPALDVARTFSDRPLYFGGPLEEGLFLVNPKGGRKVDDDDNGVEKSGVFEKIMEGMYYGRKESVGCGDEMVKRSVIRVEDFRFFDGYCGWEKEQLSDEIRAGYWDVVACSPSVIGFDGVGGVGLWEEILGLMGSKKVW